jgi:tricorn protease
VYVNRGDEISIERKNSGLLGAEFKRRSDGGYEVVKIFPGQNWSEEFRSPFLDAGVDVQTGDVITAINGVPTASVKNFYQLLENQAERVVELRILRDGQERTQRVKTITAETNLRYLAWVQSRAEMVSRLSNGKIGYVHLPNTAAEGNRELFKQFPSQISKPALIIDDRYNGGGFIPDRMIEILARKPLNYWKRRGLEPAATPLLSHAGPKAMLINGLSSSGGDALPYYFRKLKLGVIIGTRTWGGLIGISGNPGLADGGSMSAATFRLLDTDGRWAVENEGVAPDIEVIDRPELLAAGRDPSLERAVSELLKTLEQNPPQKVQAPPAPTVFGKD